MSDNPFEQPVAAETNQTLLGPASIPTTAVVISIICLILGVLGLFGMCALGGMLAAADSISQMMPEGDRDGFEQQMALQFVPGMIQIAIGVIFAPLMVAACIGCLTRKAWGRSLFMIAVTGFIVWNLFATATAIWMTVFHIEELAAPNVSAMGKEVAMQMAYATQIFAIVFSVAFLCFYIFAAVYMKRQNIKDFYAASQT